MRRTTPAASPVWPMLDFNEPIAQNCVSSVLGPERLRERGDLDRVADQRAGAVRLDVRDVAGVDAGDGERLGDDLCLTADARREVADLVAAVVVDGRAADDGEDVVAVARRRPRAASAATQPTALEMTVPADLASNARQCPSGERISPSL